MNALNGKTADGRVQPPSFVFTPSERKHMLGVDYNGLAVFPPMPIKFVHTPIRPRNGHMWLWCQRCAARRHYLEFDFIDAAKHTSPKCKKCKLRRVSKSVPWCAPRRLCMAHNGEVYMFCRTCGRYRHTESVEPTRLTTKRRICNLCHKASSRTQKLRPYTVARKPNIRISRDHRCSKCRMYSSSPVCIACQHGIRPVRLDTSSLEGRSINLMAFVLNGFRVK